ncbi:hypothetical protein C2G38_2177340 [Gigaspora rosea]|uniref:Uncharacterized protein n=2 Tax=Gigasporaceae TaxID=36753 RepID=A0A397VFG6_9GLOM|nr:hypothetical protein C2G38_2177340 [Gigaspora rosea]
MAPIRTLYSESTDAKNFQGRGYKLDSRERELESQCNELLLETEFFANKCSEFRNAKALAEARSDVITKELEKKNDKILHLQKKLNRYINDKNQNDLIKKQLKEEIKELKSKNTNLTEYKAKYYSKLEEANSFQSRIKSLEEELSLTQKYSSKKDSEIISLKAELVNIKIELDSKSIFCTQKNYEQVEKISTDIPTHTNDKIVPILESSKIDTEVTSKNVTLIRSHNITIGRSEELPIIALGASTVNKYQTTPINMTASGNLFSGIYKPTMNEQSEKNSKTRLPPMKLFLMDIDEATKHASSRCIGHPAISWPFAKLVTGKSGSDLCVAPESIQNRIIPFFTHGHHRNISPIFTTQKYHHVPMIIRENLSHILMFNGGSSPQDVSIIVGRYTDDVKSASMVINSYLRKSEFIVFDLNRAEDDPLAIRLRFDTPLDLQKEIELRQKRKTKNALPTEPTNSEPEKSK